MLEYILYDQTAVAGLVYQLQAHQVHSCTDRSKFVPSAKFMCSFNTLKVILHIPLSLVTNTM